ncbi:MAG: hypothetical protein M5U12_10580 [Verrucomicrobia bacterium]|nr:hypothetical protein [Verrucomicrobiota bacterium]
MSDASRLNPHQAVAMGLPCLALAAWCGAFAGHTATSRPLEIEDLFRCARVEDPQVSPDGRSVAYVVTRVDREGNRLDSDLWLVPLAGVNPDSSRAARSTTATRAGRRTGGGWSSSQTAAAPSSSTRWQWTAARRSR